MNNYYDNDKNFDKDRECTCYPTDWNIDKNCEWQKGKNEGTCYYGNFVMYEKPKKDDKDCDKKEDEKKDRCDCKKKGPKDCEEKKDRCDCREKAPKDCDDHKDREDKDDCDKGGKGGHEEDHCDCKKEENKPCNRPNNRRCNCCFCCLCRLFRC